MPAAGKIGEITSMRTENDFRGGRSVKVMQNVERRYFTQVKIINRL
jgi:hypothetical protein